MFADVKRHGRSMATLLAAALLLAGCGGGARTASPPAPSSRWTARGSPKLKSITGSRFTCAQAPWARPSNAEPWHPIHRRNEVHRASAGTGAPRPPRAPHQPVGFDERVCPPARTVRQRSGHRADHRSLGAGEGVAHGISVTPREVDTQLESERRLHYPTRAALEADLARHGESINELRAHIERELITERVQARVDAGKGAVTQAQVRRYYDTHRAQFHATISANVRVILTHDRPEAEAAKRELRRGALFSEVASRRSISPTRRAGGVFDGLEPGEAPAPLNAPCSQGTLTCSGVPSSPSSAGGCMKSSPSRTSARNRWRKRPPRSPSTCTTKRRQL